MLGRSAGSQPTHRIGEGATFEGTLRFSGRLEIDGTVVGAVIAEPAGGAANPQLMRRLESAWTAYP